MPRPYVSMSYGIRAFGGDRVLPSIVRWNDAGCHVAACHLLGMDHLPDRKRIRLALEAYRRPGAFLVTFVTVNRAALLGRIVDGQVSLSPAGNIVQEVLLGTTGHQPAVRLDCWVVMPDHVHVIFLIPQYFPAGLPSVIGGIKSATARLIHQADPLLRGPIWQRSFHDRALRSTLALDRARRYIALNPSRWG